MSVNRRSAGFSLTATPQNIVAGIFLLFFILTCLGGGSSRPEVVASMAIRLAAVVLLSITLLMAPASRLGEARGTLVFGGIGLAMVALQLVPLPPALWTVLPGRARFAFDAQAGLWDIWRPISLTPDLTINTLLSLFPPLAAALWIRVAGAGGRRIALYAIMIAGIASATLGLVQLAAGSETALRYYPITNADSAVGLFANRNHNAMLIAITIPLLALWAGLGGREIRSDGVLKSWLALGVALFLVAMSAVTGSRAGLVLTVMTATLSLVLHWQLRQRWAAPTRAAAPPVVVKWLPFGGALIAIFLVVFLARSTAVARLLATDPLDEQRALWLKPLSDMAWSFAPVGSGFGSFDSVFRAFEPFELLQVTYLNAAHNDLVQLVIEGGAGALALLGAFLFWWARRTFAVWRAPQEGSGASFSRAATITTGALLIASLFDYPLRMPLHAVIFAIGCAWLWADGPGTSERSKPALPASRD
jgi:hypothetical protein